MEIYELCMRDAKPYAVKQGADVLLQGLGNCIHGDQEARDELD